MSEYNIYIGGFNEQGFDKTIKCKDIRKYLRDEGSSYYLMFAESIETGAVHRYDGKRFTRYRCCVNGNRRYDIEDPQHRLPCSPDSLLAVDVDYFSV